MRPAKWKRIRSERLRCGIRGLDLIHVVALRVDTDAEVKVEAGVGVRVKRMHAMIGTGTSAIHIGVKISLCGGRRVTVLIEGPRGASPGHWYRCTRRDRN